MNDIEIEQVDIIKYLGFNLNYKNIFVMSSPINDLKIRANTIFHNFNHLDAKSKINVFNSQCLSLYGSCLFDYKRKEMKELEVAWRKSCRQVVNLPPRTHNRLLPAIMGTPDIGQMIKERFINFIKDGILHENDLISSVFKNSFLYFNYSIVNTVYDILNNFNIDIVSLFEKKKVKLKLPVIDDIWKVEIILDILYMKDFKDFTFFNIDELQI